MVKKLFAASALKPCARSCGRYACYTFGWRRRHHRRRHRKVIKAAGRMLGCFVAWHPVTQSAVKSAALIARSNIINGPPISTQSFQCTPSSLGYNAACWPSIFHKMLVPVISDTISFYIGNIFMRARSPLCYGICKKMMRPVNAFIWKALSRTSHWLR
jgi:hypothetical protein